MFLRSLARVLPTLALLLGALSTPLRAGTVSVAWDPVNAPDLQSYRIHLGLSSGDYDQEVGVGNVTSAVLSGLADCTSHFMAVKAVNNEGVSSTSYSNEVSGWARPEISAVEPITLEVGSTTRVTVTGTNFQPGARVLFSDPAISATGTNVAGCSQLTVDVTVAAGAAPGARDLSIVNPDQVFGAGSGLFALVVDETAPSIQGLAAGPIGATTASITWTTSEPADGQVFYRRTGQATFHAAAYDDGPSVDHDAELHGLTPQASYQYYVVSADAEGNSVQSATLTFSTGASSYSYLRFEAESGSPSAPLQVVSAPVAFGGAWLELSGSATPGNAGQPSGTRAYGFELPRAATWYVWLRLYGTGTQSDGWFEKVDGGVFAGIAPPATGQWRWTEARSYTLAAGLHTLTLGGHEPGARVDRVLVTDDPSFEPSEEPADDVVPPPAVVTAEVTAGDEANVLSFTHPSGTDATTIVIRYRTDAVYPVSPVDGLAVGAITVVPGQADAVDHGGLTNGTTYRYSIFTLDAAGNASPAVMLEATPNAAPPGDVDNLRRSDTL